MGRRAASDSLELVLEVLEGEGILQDLGVGRAGSHGILTLGGHAGGHGRGAEEGGKGEEGSELHRAGFGLLWWVFW